MAVMKLVKAMIFLGINAAMKMNAGPMVNTVFLVFLDFLGGGVFGF